MNSGKALRDPLTNVHSRAALEERLRSEVAHAQSQSLPLSLLVIDLDHFKSVNDAFGHTRGDRVLVEFARRVCELTRSSDPIFRYGGDEFVILLPKIGKSQAVSMAQRLLDNVCKDPYLGDPPLMLSLSIGVASFPTDAQTPESLFEIADQRQYQAKRAGRGRVYSVADAPAGTTVFNEPARLIERDQPMDRLFRFLDALPEQERGVFVASGSAGSGKTRFLSEARKVARLQGYAVLAVQGKPAQKERVYGSLAEAWHGWQDLPFPLPGEGRLAAAIQDRLAERADVGLLVTLDDIDDIDRDTLDFLRSLFHSPLPGRVALVFALDGSHQGWPQEAPLLMSAALEPLSAEGLKIWVRQVLCWEAPEKFLEWLYCETAGVPDAIQRGLACLIRQGILASTAQNWGLQEKYLAYPLKVALARQKASPPSNLPVYMTEFVGREDEIQAIKSLLREQPLVSVVGSAGIGKTRLACQAAAECIQDFPKGICFVPLASVSSADFLVHAIAEALHFPLAGPQDPKTQLLGYLSASKEETLLVLDGFEHLREGTALLLEVIERAPGTRFLVTSREHLGIAAAVSFELQGLNFPHSETEDGLEDYVSMQLFVRSARRTFPKFSLSEADRPYAARICRLMGGIPLLIELAAAWVRAFSCQEIAARIEPNLGFLATDHPEVPERHRSMLAVFDSFWGLLSKAEQNVLRKLSVFRGGFSEDAARQVAGASPFFLDALVGKTYLRRVQHGRYVLHELLRQFVAEKLNALPAERTRAQARHCKYYAAFVRRREAVLRSDRRALLEISVEIDNVRLAWRWAISQLRLAEIEHFLDGLSRFYDHNGLFEEANTTFGLAAARIQSTQPKDRPLDEKARILSGKLLAEQAMFLTRRTMYSQAFEKAWAALNLAQPGHKDGFEAMGYLQLGRALRGQGDYDGAHDQLSKALILGRRKGLSEIVSAGLSEFGEVSLCMGDHGNATTYYRQALEICQEIHDRRGEGQVSNELGMVTKNRGNYAESRDYFEQALHICHEIGDRRGEGQALNNLGHVSQHLGDYEDARLYYEQALPIYREIGDRQGESWGLNSIGYNLYLYGDYDLAQTYFEQALRLCVETGDRWGESVSLFNLGTVYLAVGEYVQAEIMLKHALALCQEIGDRWGEAWRLSHLGFFFHQRGDHPAALQFCRQSLLLAQSSDDRPLQAKVLTFLGRILAAMSRYEEAISHYLQALALRRELGEPNQAMEPLAGLASAWLKNGNPAASFGCVEEILDHLQTGSLLGTDDPFRVYLSCYEVLRSCHDPRASSLLEAAHHMLHERLEKIGSEARRSGFVQHVAVNRELEACWAKLHAEAEHRPAGA